MAMLAHRRSVLALGLAAVLLVAVAAPLCVMPADTAVAMPMTTSPMPSESDCDTQGSLVVCQSADSASIPGDSSKADTGQALAVIAKDSSAPVQPGAGVTDAGGTAEAPPPPSHLTPLRL